MYVYGKFQGSRPQMPELWLFYVLCVFAGAGVAAAVVGNL